jgi:hypothetical protein
MTTKVLTADDFRTHHDKSYIVPKKIEAGLKKLGAKGYLYQAEFMKLCEVNNPADFNAYCGAFEADHCVVIGGSKAKRAWAGSKEFAERLRAML